MWTLWNDGLGYKLSKWLAALSVWSYGLLGRGQAKFNTDSESNICDSEVLQRY